MVRISAVATCAQLIKIDRRLAFSEITLAATEIGRVPMAKFKLIVTTTRVISAATSKRYLAKYEPTSLIPS